MTRTPRLPRALVGAAAVALIAAGPASADPKHPLDVLETVRELSDRTGPQRVRQRVKDKDYEAMLALMNATYGEAKKSRAGLQVWAIDNPDAGLGGAPVITVILGRDDPNRRALLVIDDRGESPARARKRERRQARRNRDAFPRVEIAPPPPMAKAKRKSRLERGASGRAEEPEI